MTGCGQQVWCPSLKVGSCTCSSCLCTLAEYEGLGGEIIEGEVL